MMYKINGRILDDFGQTLRDKLDSDVKYTPAGMVEALKRLEQYRTMQIGDIDLDNGFYGRRAASVAESYLYARQILRQEFNYKVDNFLTNHQPGKASSGGDDANDPDTPDSEEGTSYSPDNDFSNYDPATTYGFRLYDYATQPSTKLDGTYPNHIAPCMDCSSFVLLALLGIPWANSPWVRYGDPKNGVYTWDAKNLETLMNMSYDGTGWQQKELIYQPAGLYRDIGMQRNETVVKPDGSTETVVRRFSCIRNAADLAQFYVNQGNVIYDRPIYLPEDREKNVPTQEQIWSIVQPGDLVFWSNTTKNASGDTVMRQPNRFRCVSHVAIVGNNPTRTVEVTSGSKLPNAVYYRLLNNETNPDGSAKRTRLNGITLIIRPDYRPNRGAEEIPLNKNLLTYPWTYSQARKSTNSGITRQTLNGNVIHLSGTSTSQTTTYLKGSTTNGAYNYLVLTPGKYTLSGMDGSGIQSNSLSLRVRKSDGTEFPTPIRCYDGHKVRFEITEPTSVQVVLYISSGITVNCDIAPVLVRDS